MRDGDSAADGGPARDLAIVALFECALLFPFLGAAFHIDEPFFLAAARHFLSDPADPMRFAINWLGSEMPAFRTSYYPSLLPVLEAGVMAAGVRSEWAMRAAFLPLDLAAACSLYGLARRFLDRPLLPVLIVLAGPAYFINMRALMAEKCVGAFAFTGLYLLVEGIERGCLRRTLFSALLLSAAVMFKYTCLFFLLPAAAYSLHRKVPLARIATFLAAAIIPAAAYLLWTHSAQRWSVAAARSSYAASDWAAWPHRLRALLAFMGGSTLVTAAWPLLDLGALQGRRWPWLLAAAAALPFLPGLDGGPVRGGDRLLGAVLAAGGVLACARLLVVDRPRIRGWVLWISWAAGVLIVQGVLGAAVTTRLMLFLGIPLILAAASALESRVSAPELRRVHAASLVGVLTITLGLAFVDAAYSGAQRDLARLIEARYGPRGTRVWFTGHWGLQHYLESIGARGLDSGRGGWDEVRPGDAVVVPLVNSHRIAPRLAIRARALPPLTIRHPVPLRLMSPAGGQAGFYSSAWGFLPFSIGSELLDEFVVYEML